MRTRPLITALLAVTVAVAGCGQPAGAALRSGTSTVQHRDKAQHVTTQSTPHAKRHAAKARARATIVARPAATGTAAAALAKLAVKGRAPKTGYSREQFGDGWITTRGCGTRERILTRDLSATAYLDDCRVESGRLADPYTSARIRFTRGGASEVDIDHVVALSDAWQKGAQQWPAARRVAFANDPLNLLAVDAHANRSKGDGDAATWLPKNKPFRCAYVARQVAVKRKYKLAITAAEKSAIGRVLGTCPGQKLPKPGRIPVTRIHTEPTPTSTPGQDSDSGASDTGHVYANCTAARAAGVTPILRGTPDYAANPRLDRDRDGVACES